MVLGKKMAIFDWEWGRNSALEMGRKGPVFVCDVALRPSQQFFSRVRVGIFFTVYTKLSSFRNEFTIKLKP